jgi:tetratricopeptide (TPR) repeat protein
MHYKGTGAKVDDLGRELGVQYVLEGSVRRDADSVRITAQLIQVDDQTHVWAQQYDRRQTEVLTVQSEIAQAIADQIEIVLAESPSPGHPPDLSRRGLEAYDFYLRGRYFWNKRTADGFQRAIEAFQQAIDRNPGDARAHAGLADTYALMGTYGIAPNDAQVIAKARAAALKALELDESLAAAHTSLALISEFFDLDWQTAESRFRRAIELDMNYVTAHHWYAECLAFLGRFDEALAEIEIARQLDPLSLIIAADRGAILYYARQYDRAIEQFRFVLSTEPTIGRATLIIPAYVQQGRFDEALAQIAESRKTFEGPWMLAWESHVHGRAGRPEEARKALLAMEEANRPLRGAPLMLCATARAGMGDVDEALACLLQACKEEPSALVSLKVDPIFDPLRDDPRFEEVLRCAHLGS